MGMVVVENVAITPLAQNITYTVEQSWSLVH